MRAPSQSYRLHVAHPHCYLLWYLHVPAYTCQDLKDDRSKYSVILILTSDFGPTMTQGLSRSLQVCTVQTEPCRGLATLALSV